MSRLSLQAGLLALLLLSACSRVTPEQYNKIQAGMTRDEVYGLLGKPDEVSGSSLGSLSLSSETWRGAEHRIDLSFFGDKLATKSIRSAETE